MPLYGFSVTQSMVKTYPKGCCDRRNKIGQLIGAKVSGILDELLESEGNDDFRNYLARVANGWFGYHPKRCSQNQKQCEEGGSS